MAAESRPAGDVSPEHDEEDDDQSDERHTRSRLRLVADVDGSEGQAREECDPDDGENDVPRWEACAPAAEVGAEGRGRKHDREDDRDRPAGVRREDVVRDVVDLLVLDSDHALRAENLQDQALADEQAGERDYEGGNADERDDRPLREPDHDAGQDRERERDETGIVVAGPRLLVIGDGDAREAAEKADREVDLADQQHEHDSDRDHRRAGHLPDQVLEVDGGKEDARLRAEEERDRDDSDDHRQAADVA